MREAVGFGLESALILSLDDLDYRYCSPEPIERESWGMSARQSAESASDAAHRTCNGCDNSPSFSAVVTIIAVPSTNPAMTVVG